MEKSVNRPRQVDLSSKGYRVIKEIGRGGYAHAHLVSVLDAPREFYVAKCIDLEPLKERDKTLAKQEVEVLRSMNHPNIVKLKEGFIFQTSLLVLVLEYCEQGELRGAIKAKAAEGEYFNEPEIMRWFAQLVDALAYVHSQRIIHRDLKSNNVFLKQGRALLGDFGMSKVFEGSLQAAMTVVGTPFYTSPEICKHEPYNYKTDIWSLGCVLYELCTLQHPFIADNLLNLVPKILNDPHPPIPAQYSREINSLISRLLAKKPEDRPTASELVKDPLISVSLNASPAPNKPREYSEQVQFLLGKIKRRIELEKIDWMSLFMQFDLSGSGQLDITNFQTAILSLSLGLSEREAVSLSFELSRENKTVWVGAFRTAMENVPAPVLLAEGWAREKLLGSAETLNSGPFIPESDFIDFLKTHHLAADEISKIKILADKSLAGEINWENFSQRFLQPEIVAPKLLLPPRTPSRTPPRTPALTPRTPRPSAKTLSVNPLIAKLRRGLTSRGIDGLELFSAFSSLGKLTSESVTRALTSFPVGLSSVEVISLNEQIRSVLDVQSFLALLSEEPPELSPLNPGEAKNLASEIVHSFDPSGWQTESSLRPLVERVLGNVNNWDDFIFKETFRDPEGRIDGFDLLERLGAAMPKRPVIPAKPGQQPVNDATFVALVSRSLFSLEELKINFPLISICGLRDVYRDGFISATQASLSLWKAPLGLSQAEADALVSRLCCLGLGIIKIAEAKILIDQVTLPGSALGKVLKSQVSWILEIVRGLKFPGEIPAECSREQFLQCLADSGLSDPSKSRALLLFCDKSILFQPRKFFRRFLGNGRLLTQLSSN